MTLPEVRDIFEYWRGSPPVHELVASFLGVKSPGPAAGSRPSERELQAMMDAVNTSYGVPT